MRCLSPASRSVKSKVQVIIVYDQLLFDTYLLLDSIGKGIRAEVYLARHIRLKQLRVIKRISKQESLNNHFYEPEILGLCRHRGIPILYDTYEDSAYLYLVEEYVPGESLETYLMTEKRISARTFLTVGLRLMDILAVLHENERPILYLNWSPSHIFLHGDEVYLLDYSAALYESDAKPASEAPADIADISGCYAAPEQHTNRRRQKKTDIYGIGAVLLQMRNYVDQCDPDVDSVLKLTQETEPEQRPSLPDLREFFARSLNALEAASRKGDRHVKTKIAVVGSHHGIGTTHFAISACACLNHRSYEAFMDIGRDMALLIQRYRKAAVYSENALTLGDFKARILPETDSDAAPVSGSIIIKDMGIFGSWDVELEECDDVFVLLGQHPWDMERSRDTAYRLRFSSHVHFLVSYGNRTAALQYTELLKRPVGCFPIDRNPFSCSDEKLRFFDALMNQKGKGR